MTATTTVRRSKETVIGSLAGLRTVIHEHIEDGEQERRLPDAVMAAMTDAGLFRLWIPREYGGDELPLPDFMEVVEAIAGTDGAAGWVFANVAAAGMQAAFMASEGAQEVFGTTPGTPRAGAFAPRGRAVPVNGGYMLTGRWPLASGSHHARWLGAGALVFDGQAPRMNAHGVPDLKLMFFPPEDCQVLDTWYSTGLRGTGSTDIAVNDIFIPERRAFSQFTAEPHVSGPLYRVGILPLFSFAITAVGLGIARGAIDAFVELARDKTPTLSQSTLGGRPTVHADVARAEATLQSARAYLFDVAHKMMTMAELGNSMPDDLEASRRLACVHSAAACEQVVDMMFKLGGSTSIYTGHKLERCLRDLHTANQHILVSPVWWEKTGQYYLGLGLGMP
jgi:alkylation response protein AidB-like acyl-CoA dehydrogenase